MKEYPELDAILERNERQHIDAETLDVIVKYYPKFAKQRKVNELMIWLRENMGKDLNKGQIEQAYSRNKEGV